MMRPANPLRRITRVSRFESFEPRLVMSTQAVADFYLETHLSSEINHHAGTLDEINHHTSAIGEINHHTNSLNPTLADVHDLTGVSYARNAFGFDGSQQTVVVIDSGIAYDHYALGGGFGSGYRVVGGWDFTEENDADPYDDGPAGFHGTHVAGIIGSSDDTYEGVASDVDLIGLRVFNDQGAGYFSWVENALQWVHDNRLAFDNPITTVNLSIGTTYNGDSPPNWAMLEDEFSQLKDDGIFISVSAGNSFSTYNTTGLSYPAASSFVVPVASTDNDGTLSSFSQRNNRVLAAPGRSITSTVPDYVFGADGIPNDFGTASGTSMAAPYVAGASVLLREAMELMGYQNITQDTIYDHFRNTADLVYDSATDAYYHRINVQQALDAIMPEDDYGSSSNDAHSLGTLTSDSEVAGMIGRMDDVDYFTFTADRDSTISFSAQTTFDLAASWSVEGGQGTVVDGVLTFEVIQGQSYTVSLSTTNGIGNYDMAIDYAEGSGEGETGTPWNSLTDWGTVDFTQLSSQDLSSGNSWYKITAARDGILTAETIFSHAAGDINLEFYNFSGSLLTASSSSSDNERLDLNVSAGDELVLHAQGANADVGFRVTNLLEVQGQAYSINGTAGDDDFVVSIDGDYHVSLNGTQYTFSDSALTTWQFDGGSGSDSLDLTASSLDDSVVFQENSISLTSSAYQVAGSNFFNILASGGAGSDSALMYDSAGNDIFSSRFLDSSLTGSTYANRAIGFESAKCISNAGGSDVAYFNDTSGNDVFVSTSLYAYLKSSGVVTQVNGFDSVKAVATAGGHDAAYFYDTSGNDVFVSTSLYSYLKSSDVVSQVHGFDSVKTIASSGGFDVAYFYDTSGNDLFVSTSYYSYFKGGGLVNQVNGFDRVKAISPSGGIDVAYLYDTSGDDTFVSTANYSYLKGSGIVNQVNGFERIKAISSAGGTDTAYLYDTSGDDLFVATSSYAYFKGSGLINQANGFSTVMAMSTAGGNDTAILHGSVGNDTLTSNLNDHSLSGSGYLNQATGFESTRVYSGGGVDQAVFNDLGDDDSFYGRDNYGIISNSTASITFYDIEQAAAQAVVGQSPSSDIQAVDYVFNLQGVWS